MLKTLYNELAAEFGPMEGWWPAETPFERVAGLPPFVVDAYARRILKCLGIAGNYRHLQQMLHESLPVDVDLFRHFHALFVEHGKQYCNKKACANCAVKRTIHGRV